jgi:hyperosmotically inducible periplasmic protein
MKQKITCTAVMALLTSLAIIGATGCATSSSKDERSEGRALDDKNLASKIRKSLDEEPVYKFGGVDVKAFGGEVQLSGFVNTEEQKERAGDLASQTPGVFNVHNNLVLKPVAPTPTGRDNSATQQNRIYSPPTQPQAPVKDNQPAQPEQK